MFNVLNRNLGTPVYGVPKKQDPFLLGMLGSAAIGGLASLFGGHSSNRANIQAVRETNETNRQIAAETNKANRDLYNQQFADSVKMFNMQNEYNSPVAERARLTQAGLNPALSFGDSQGAASMELPSASPMQGATMQAPQYSDVIGSSIANMSSFIPAIASSLKDTQEAQNVNIGNMFASEQYRAQINKLVAEGQQALSQGDLNKGLKKKVEEEINGLRTLNYINDATMNSQIESFTLKNDMMKMQKNVLEEQRKNFAADTLLKDSMRKLNVTENTYRAQLLKAQIDKLVSDADLNSSLSEESLARKIQTEWSTKGIIISTNDAHDIAKEVKKKLPAETKYINNQNYAFWPNFSIGAFGSLKSALSPTASIPLPIK